MKPKPTEYTDRLSSYGMITTRRRTLFGSNTIILQIYRNTKANRFCSKTFGKMSKATYQHWWDQHPLLQVLEKAPEKMIIKNYLLTESVVLTGRSQTETRQGRGLRCSRNDRTFKVNKLLIIWLFVLSLQARNWPMGIAGEIPLQ